MADINIFTQGIPVTGDNKRQPDELDKEIERWVAQNQTPVEVVGSLIGSLTDQFARFCIPGPVSYIYLSVLTYMLRKELVELSKDELGSEKHVEHLEVFIARLVNDSSQQHQEMLRKIKKDEDEAKRAAAPPDKKDPFNIYR